MTDKEKLEKLKKLADAMYYAAQQLTTDASRLHKAMDEYHKFIIHECKEEPVSKIIFDGNFNKSWFANPELAFKAGAYWQKEQMKKNAVSGHIGQTVNGILRVLSNKVDDELGFEAGDKVKLIIIKED